MAVSQNSASITDLAANGAGNQPPSAKSLTPDREGPQTAGSRVSWTVNAYDADGDKLLYQFWLNSPATGNTWKPMTGWIENNTWTWTTSPVDSGLNIIDIRIRDERHAGTWSHDSHISAEWIRKEIQFCINSFSKGLLQKMSGCRRPSGRQTMSGPGIRQTQRQAYKQSKRGSEMDITAMQKAGTPLPGRHS